MIARKVDLPPIRRPRKSNPRSELSDPKQKRANRIGQYISESLQKVDGGCYRNGHICIDSGFGDYRMQLFRLKDRNRHFKSSKSVFTQSFTNQLQKLVPELKQQLHKIINKGHEYYQDKIQQQINPQKVSQQISEWSSQEEQFLYYQYVSDYQKEKFFRKPVVEEIKKQQKKQQKIQEVKEVKKKKKKKKQFSHFFKFLDKKYLNFHNFH